MSPNFSQLASNTRASGQYRRNGDGLKSLLEGRRGLQVIFEGERTDGMVLSTLHQVLMTIGVEAEVDAIKKEYDQETSNVTERRRNRNDCEILEPIRLRRLSYTPMYDPQTGHARPHYT
eukprot:scaffold11481_cov172-Cylindrotheca_fusiformis.AAC.2